MIVIDKKQIENKSVFLRVDFNVPLTKNENLLSDYRIEAALPTIQYLIKQKAKIILATHLGNPGGFDESLSTDKLLPVLKNLAGVKISKASDFNFSELKKLTSRLQGGNILLLENLRFHKGEVDNDAGFAKSLSELAEIYVNDAFGVVHRAHASIVSLPKFLPSYAGLLMAKEIKILSEVFESKARPLTFVVGGGKATTKDKFLKKIVKEADFILIGGVLANVFLKSKGYIIGRSKADEESIRFVSGLKFRPGQLVLPDDFITGDILDESARTRIVDRFGIKDKEYFLDIGPESLKKFAAVIEKSKIVVWNGPLGYYEMSKFAQGTLTLGKILASSKAKKIIGGGDLIAALSEFVKGKKFDHVSTGGGAMLEFLAGERLPGLEALGYYN